MKKMMKSQCLGKAGEEKLPINILICQNSFLLPRDERYDI
jgi:hypothetical protein